ncbi:hypothetical protein ABTM61_19180, partial [Acinetobacter baumannii]
TPPPASPPVAGESRPVVQPTTPAATAPSGQSPGQRLNAALSRLAREPRSADALGEAGAAALALGDAAAALGFDSRALEVAPGDGRTKVRVG